MKHASPDVIRALDPLLQGVRSFDGLKERKPGIFYRKGAAFLHFHEDREKVFADLKGEEGWIRLEVGQGSLNDLFLQKLKEILKA